MNLRKTAAKSTLVGALSVAAVGLGTGLSQAEPLFPPPPPPPIPAPDVSSQVICRGPVP
jgi:hypothetical protein